KTCVAASGSPAWRGPRRASKDGCTDTVVVPGYQSKGESINDYEWFTRHLQEKRSGMSLFSRLANERGDNSDSTTVISEPTGESPRNGLFSTSLLTGKDDHELLPILFSALFFPRTAVFVVNFLSWFLMYLIERFPVLLARRSLFLETSSQ